MNMHTFHACPACHRVMRTAPEFGGRTVACSYCKAEFVQPMENDDAAAAIKATAYRIGHELHAFVSRAHAAAIKPGTLGGGMSIDQVDNVDILYFPEPDERIVLEAKVTIVLKASGVERLEPEDEEAVDEEEPPEWWESPDNGE